MEKVVRERDGNLRSEFFTKDAIFFPFVDTAIVGLAKLKPYLIAYNKPDVKIDSISIYTYHSEIFESFILEYTKFDVNWSVPQNTGSVKGNGIRIWKSLADKSLKIFREISTYTHF